MLASDVQDLESLLRRSVVKVTTPGGHGTGFVVGPSLVLTCRHVVVDAVERGATVSVEAFDGRPAVAATVREARPTTRSGWPDLALLDVPGVGDLPAVLLDAQAVPRGVRLLVGGYPKDSSVVYQTRGFESGGQENYAAEGVPYLRLDDDVLIGGMSGAPVLDAESGVVRAVTRLTIDDTIPVGGFAVPMATVLDELPELRAAYDRPGPGARQWCESLGGVKLRDLRRDPDGSRWDAEPAPVDHVDLELTPSGPDDAPLAAWRVSADGHPECEVQLRASDLDPDTDVMEAVDRWSRRRTYSRREEVELLGRLLYRWLLPTQVRQLVDERLGAGAPFLLRVRVDSKNRLAAVPWEYARLSTGHDPLATVDSLALVRRVSAPGIRVTRKDRLKVLVVAVCPQKVQEQLPGRRQKRRAGLTRPGTGAQLAAGVKASVRSDRIEVVHHHDVSIDSFRDLLAEGVWDVVHYVGFGWDWEDDDEPALAFMEGSEMAPIPLSTVRAALASSQTPFVVLQMLPLPHLDATPPLGSARLLPLLSGAVQGLVVAENALTDSHVTSFSSRFYDNLAKGQSLETAVQAGRRGLYEIAPDGDHAAFGGITVTTTEEGDLRPLTGAAGQAGGSIQGAVAGRNGGPAHGAVR